MNKPLDEALEFAGDAAVHGAVAVTSIIIGGVFLDWSYPYVKGIPVLGDLAGAVRAAWRKVYNP